MEGLDDFKVTNIGGLEVAEAPQQEAETTQLQTEQPQDEVQQEQSQGHENQLQPDVEQTVEQNGEAQGQKQEITPEPSTDDGPLFEASTVDFDEAPGTTQAEQEQGQPANEDLLTFLDKHNDLIQEYNSLNQNFDEMKQEDLIKNHLASQHPDLSSEDLDSLVSDYSFDENTDERADIVRKKIAMQKAADEAKDFFTTKGEAVRQELAKRQLGGPTPEDTKVQQHREAVVADFNQQTNNFFEQGFEGFDFQLNDQKNLHLKINNKEAIRNTQSSIDNFLGQFFDADTKKITDPAGYHKAIFAAMNTDAITRNAYEQGKSDAISQQTQDMKNIDMNGRQTHASNPTQGTKWTIT